MSQTSALTVKNFLSAATGMAVAFALIRGFARKQVAGIGNFWVYVTRVTLYLMLPACVVPALIYVALGVPQTFAASATAITVESVNEVTAIGPVAS